MSPQEALERAYARWLRKAELSPEARPYYTAFAEGWDDARHFVSDFRRHTYGKPQSKARVAYMAGRSSALAELRGKAAS